jgi:hypothetical protein
VSRPKHLSGGDKLAKALAEMARRVSNPGTLRVGFLENATYPDGKPVALVAAIQNFGAPARNIPPRPFFSNMIREKSPSWPQAIAAQLQLANYDARLALERVGQGISGQLRQSIVNFNSVPLSPKTIARKGFDKQLVDTGHMLNSVSHLVSR